MGIEKPKVDLKTVAPMWAMAGASSTVAARSVNGEGEDDEVEDNEVSVDIDVDVDAWVEAGRLVSARPGFDCTLSGEGGESGELCALLSMSNSGGVGGGRAIAVLASIFLTFSFSCALSCPPNNRSATFQMCSQ